MRSNNLPAEADLLKRVTVRLIELHEREEFDRRLEADHYLGRCALYGPSVRYVAELDGQYVALYLKARDRWFGWSPRQRARRLGLGANNSRFLVLPGVPATNLKNVSLMYYTRDRHLKTPAKAHNLNSA